MPTQEGQMEIDTPTSEADAGQGATEGSDWQTGDVQEEIRPETPNLRDRGMMTYGHRGGDGVSYKLSAP